jgi:hypothetical protein
MDAAIQSQLQKLKKKPEEVSALILDKCNAPRIIGLDAFVNLESLSMNNVGLTSLENFPHLPKLKKVAALSSRYGWLSVCL